VSISARVSSATAAIVLQPEKTAHWQLLAEVLRRSGDTAGADTVFDDGGA
jgi:hypothetical protein